MQLRQLISRSQGEIKRRVWEQVFAFASASTAEGSGTDLSIAVATAAGKDYQA